MEACNVVCNRDSLRLAIIIVVVTLMFSPLGRLSVAGMQQTPAGSAKDTQQKKSNDSVKTQSQEVVPPDHYDPDDAKTYPDVRIDDQPVLLQGRELIVHFYRPAREGAAIPAIYACGDGGWRGLAPRTAQQLAHIGFAVAGIDSKVYLRDFSSPASPLTIKQLATDYSAIAGALRTYARSTPTTPVYVYGWSLGAGFAIAVGTDQDTRSNWAGIISIGLPKQNQLVSGLGANHANLKDELNSRYGFRSENLMGAIAPLPLVMIQSTTDTASPPKVGQALYNAAKDPKLYVLIKASNHRFTGARDEFYAALGNAVTWMRDPNAQVSRR
jgi:hypothetical protein